MLTKLASQVSYSPECELILEHIYQNKIQALFHFTSVQNLPEIAWAQGLLSKQELQRREKWPCPDPGGNKLSHDLDRDRDNWSKVSLSYTPYTPMAYRRKPEKHLCYLVLKPEVLCFDGVLFTNMNATANGHIRAEGLAGLQQVYFDEVTCPPRGWDREWLAKAQAEILVPDFIPLNFVEHIGFVSKASLDYGRHLWHLDGCPECLIEPRYFAHDPRYSVPAIPYLDAVVLSSKTIMEIEKDIDVQQATPHESTFSGFWDRQITVKALVEGYPGSKVYAQVEPARIRSDEITFPMRQKRGVFFSFDIDRLSVGLHHIDFYIEAVAPILWAQIPFEVTE